MERIKRFFICYILRDHDWTCDAEQGIKPTQLQLDAGVDGFKDYATMYCKRCGGVYEGIT